MPAATTTLDVVIVLDHKAYMLVRPAPPEATIAISSAAGKALLRGRPTEASAAARRVAGQMANTIDALGYCRVRLGALRLSMDVTSSIARTLVAELRAKLADEGCLPAPVTVECDEPDTTAVVDGFAYRTRLPHTDGQHATYLTPSRFDAPYFDSARRRFGPEGHTSASHKLYAGIVVFDPGVGLSITTFLDAVVLAVRAFEHDARRVLDDLGEVARWQGANVAAAHARRRSHGSRYISILGLFHPDGDPSSEGLNLSIAETGLGNVAERKPGRPNCACGRCSCDTEAAFCGQVAKAFGVGWHELREEHEYALGSDQGDLLFWDNVTMLHGAVLGSAGRTLMPIYLSLERPAGFTYERWLFDRWRMRAATLLRPTQECAAESVDAVSAESGA